MDKVGGLTVGVGWGNCIKCLKREWNKKGSGKQKNLKGGCLKNGICDPLTMSMFPVNFRKVIFSISDYKNVRCSDV